MSARTYGSCSLQRESLEAIVRNISAGIVGMSQEKRIIFANPAAVCLLNVPEGRLLAGDFLELFHNNDRQRVGILFKLIADPPFGIL